MFILQSQESTSGLELAASQFGLRLPNTQGSWGTPLYVELLSSYMLLKPIAVDTLVVREDGGRKTAVMDLLRVPQLPLPQRTERAVRMLRHKILATEDKRLNAVRLAVSTRWPSVSFDVAERLVRGVNQFNLETRKTQATEERRFVEGRATEAERALREAEDRLQRFMQRNRSIAGSPELTFEQDRLQRDVSLRQSILTSLLQRREEARIREVRDVPVVTVIENPRVPVAAESRRVVMKSVLGWLAATAASLLLGFLLDARALARRERKVSVLGLIRAMRDLLASRPVLQ